jgi:GNAT superfamily N-acetyltransferase
MKLITRNATASDLTQIVAMMREFAEFENLLGDFRLSEDSLREAVFGEKAFVLLLVAAPSHAANVLSAFALLYPKFASFRGERSLYLEDLYVKQNERGKGFGLALLKAAAKLAKNDGFERLDWQALKWNKAAIDFYLKIGAEPDEGNVNFRLAGAAFENLAA